MSESEHRVASVRVILFRQYAKHYHGLCPLCGKNKVLHLHEIIPRRLVSVHTLPVWLQVPLCRTCNLNEGEVAADSRAARIVLIRAASKVWGIRSVEAAYKWVKETTPTLPEYISLTFEEALGDRDEQ